MSTFLLCASWKGDIYPPSTSKPSHVNQSLAISAQSRCKQAPQIWSDGFYTQAVNLCSSNKNQNQSSQIWNVEGAIPLYFLQFTEPHWDKINYSYSVLLTKNAISEEEQGRTKHTHQKVVDGGMLEDWSFLSQPTLAVVSSCHLNHQELVQCSSISFF
jgi:hypothetical protein